ncbi:MULTISPECIES: hypothetical protein [unclassified Adlercreutzia]|uniref:hypothetical protein n=1 Tax=unclassified Adlercreutzia TaxID=2636013 RepID=UPI0013EC7D07|nr:MULTISPECIES: hypothetical protein [unclassified Adlercreutzia]
MPSPTTLFIVEGLDRDYRFAREMASCFLDRRVNVICLPAEQNIYMLYKLLAADDFDTDVVEVLRESVPSAAKVLEGISRGSVDEIYLFFDYDPHQNYFPAKEADALASEMLAAFDNETENGKLYISYPMVEALYDFRADQCQAYSNCYVDAGSIAGYKRAAGDGNPNSGCHMGSVQWKGATSSFALRCKCLLGIDDLTFESYRALATPESIFHEERRLLREEGRVFVLSAFPEFLLDYFKPNFFNAMAPLRKLKYDRCPKEARRSKG